MTSNSYLNAIMSFLTAGPPTGGLEISDSALRFVASSSTGVYASVRVEPGVFMEGKIKDEAAFRAALRSLRQQVLGRKASSKAPVNVVVSLSSINIYSQVFALPPLEGENLEKAVDLNIKMALPSGAAETYSGWQTLHSGESKIEILSAFFDKSLADDLTDILRSERFVPIAIEPRALSIARLIKIAASGFDPKMPAIALSVDTSGIDAAIIRNGNLHFDYFYSWQDLEVGKNEMTLEMFSALVVRSVQQILNFYSSHWKEPLGKILVAATGMQNDILDIIRKNFSVPAEELTLAVSPPITPEWFVALGSAFRGRIPRRDDSELSILGVGARELFREEQVESFLRFWRLLVPLSLSLMLLVFLGAWAFARSVNTRLQQETLFAPGGRDEKDAAALKQAAENFNRSVDIIYAAEHSTNPKSPTLQKLIEMANVRSISITRLSLGVAGAPATLNGIAPTEEAIRQLKDELTVTPGFREVNLPITQIHREGSGFGFSISFITSS